MRHVVTLKIYIMLQDEPTREMDGFPLRACLVKGGSEEVRK